MASIRCSARGIAEVGASSPLRAVFVCAILNSRVTVGCLFLPDGELYEAFGLSREVASENDDEYSTG